MSGDKLAHMEMNELYVHDIDQCYVIFSEIKHLCDIGCIMKQMAWNYNQIAIMDLFHLRFN